MSSGGPEEQGAPSLAGGRLLAEIVCVLSDGFTAIERTMMEGGEQDQVLELRRGFQRMMKERYTEMIEMLTGRKVLAFLSQANVEPELTVEIS